MDYCAKESTLNLCCDEVRDPTIKMSIQETYNILTEMNEKLNDFSQIVNGKPHDEKVQKNAVSLWDESRMLVRLSKTSWNYRQNVRVMNTIKRFIAISTKNGVT